MAFSVHERHTSHKLIFHSQTHTRKYGFKLFKQFAICLTFGYFLMVLFILQRFFSLLVFVIVVFVVVFCLLFLPHSISFSFKFVFSNILAFCQIHFADFVWRECFAYENNRILWMLCYCELFSWKQTIFWVQMQFQQNKLLSVSKSNFISTSYNMIALELKCCVDWTLENKIEIDFYCRPKLRTNLQIFFFGLKKMVELP